MDIKLVVSDVDGTLIDQTETVSSLLVDTVKKCRDMGIIFSLATGRTKELAAPIVRKLGITNPYAISNGACIIEGDQCLKSYGFSVLPVLEILKEADSQGLTVTCSDEETERAFRETAYVKRHRLLGGRFRELINPEQIDWKNKTFQKIMIMDEERTGKISSVSSRLKKEAGDRYWITTYSDQAVELGPKACNKATGVKTLADLLGIELSQTMVCGDFLNDYEMVSQAGVGVAVQNACEELKQIADFVTRGECALGVVEAIEKYCFKEVEG